MVVDVELGDGDVAGVLVGDLGQDRRDLLARTAPFGPEVDDDGLVGADHALVEGVGGQVDDAVCHGAFLSKFTSSVGRS